MTNQTERIMTMIDIRNPKQVEVDASVDGTIVWVNVDGLCRLRIQGIPADGLLTNGEQDNLYAAGWNAAIEAAAALASCGECDASNRIRGLRK